jgi:type IV pilus assembly protein PilB
MQRLVLDEASTNDIRKLAIQEGMITLRMDGLNKVKQGLSTLEEMLRVII